MWHKAIWKGHSMRLEITSVGLLVELANHYTTRGAHLSNVQTTSWAFSLSLKNYQTEGNDLIFLAKKSKVIHYSKLLKTHKRNVSIYKRVDFHCWLRHLWIWSENHCLPTEIVIFFESCTTPISWKRYYTFLWWCRRFELPCLATFLLCSIGAVTIYGGLLRNGYRRRKIDPTNLVQTLNEFVRGSFWANAYGKGMNPSLLPPAMSK